jgi:hypothetical protein
MFTWPGCGLSGKRPIAGGQFYLGYDPETQIEHGTDEESAQLAQCVWSAPLNPVERAFGGA